jgi:hypothetical protein
MTKPEMIDLLFKSIPEWNIWRMNNPTVVVDLRDANLRGAKLSGANLSYANLHGADLRGADLSSADLRGADLSGAYLRYANLRGANLRGADLGGANLSYANLSGAYLRYANLRYANLHGADLHGADLSDTDLRYANLSYAKNIPSISHTIIIPEGDLIVYKKVSTGIAKLLIPAAAARSSATGRKCRAEFAKVLECLPNATSIHDKTFKYVVGDIVHPIGAPYDTNRWNECAPGIHFFLTREEAENY